MSGLWHDLRQAVRSMRTQRAYALLAITTLALGIGANTAIFSVINGVFLRPLPYAHGDQMMLVRQPATKFGGADDGFSVIEVQDYRRQATSALAGVDEYHSMTFTLYGHGDPARVTSGVVSSQFFDDLGVRPLLGRTFLPGEDAVGAPPLALLSHSFWISQFGGDPRVVGRTFTMNDKVHTIIGVLPPLPRFPDANDIYIPAGSCPFRSAPVMMNDRAMRMVSMLARAKPGVSHERATADLRAVAARLHADYPATFPPERGLVIETQSFRDALTRDARPTFLALLAMTGFLLLIACANVANLTLARHIRRSRDMAMRIALGATRWRLLRQLVTESTVIAVAGGVAGLLLAAVSLGLLRQFAARFTPHTADIRIDAVVLLFTLGVSLATGLVFGALPALPTHDTPSDVMRATRGGLRSALVVAQVAIAFVLLVAAGLMARTLVNLRRVDPGYDASHVMTALVPLNWTKYADTTAVAQFADGLVRELRQSAGVASVGISGALPLDGQPTGRNPIRLADRTGQAEFSVVGGDYFRTIGVTVLAGRDFTDADRNQHVTIVNQTAARQLWSNVDPVGQRLSPDSGRTWYSVVGIVRDVRQHDLTSDVGPLVYAPYARFPQQNIRVLVRGAGEAAIRAAVHALDAQQPVAQVQSLEALRRTSLASPQLMTVLSLAFAIVALLLTAAGLGGVMAFTVAQRTRELGIRLALGAQREAVLAMVLRQGMTLVAAGLVFGAVAAFVATRGLSGLLFGVRPTDVPTYAVVLAGIVVVTLAACFLPARRATLINPIAALKY